MPTVFANGRSIIHKGDGNTNIAGPPDVCKTPTPGGPVPIPYPNIAKSGDLADGSKKTEIEGNPIALKGSNLSTSTGNEPGTAGGGIMSSKTKGKMGWAMGSIDVKIEGQGVVRFMDPTLHNGNSYNDAFIQKGGTGLAYGDDFEGKCPICGEDPEKHRLIEYPNSVEAAKKLIKALQDAYNDKKPVLKANEVKNLADTTQKGCMIGVMVCKCNKIHAAMSGKTVQGFVDVVDELGYEYCGKRETKKDNNGKTIETRKIDTSEKGKVGKDEMFAANKHFEAKRYGKGGKDMPFDPTSGKKYNVELEKINKEFNEAKEDFNKNWKIVEKKAKDKIPDYNPMAKCSAFKLIARNKGHAPVSMTEMFFNLPEKTEREKKFDLMVKRHKFDGNQKLSDYSEEYQKELLSSKGAKRLEIPVKSTSEESCLTCQAMLPFALCNIEEQQCPGGK